MSLAAPEAKDAGPSCERLRGERHDRCVEELRRAGIERQAGGPESTGMGSGAGSAPRAGAPGNSTAGPSGPH
jgi:hypothetical protein